MNSSLVLRSRRSKSSQTEATCQLILFFLRHERFALPIYAVQKVITLEQLYGSTPGCSTSLTLYQNQEVPVIDIAQSIFGQDPQQKLPAIAASKAESSALVVTQPQEVERFLIIVQNLQGESVGFAIDSQPALRRVPESAFAPLSPTYQQRSNIRCVRSLVILNQNEPPSFLLDLHQLLEPQPKLLPGAG